MRVPRWRSTSSILALLLLSALAAASLPAQNVNMAGLQGDAVMVTPGGWVWPAADPGNPHPNPPNAYLNNRIQLGKALFWDEQVSTSDTMACGTCHIPEAGGTDPRAGGFTANGLGQTVQGSFGVVPQNDILTGLIDYGFVAPPSFQETRSVTPFHVPTMIGAYVFNNLLWQMGAGPVFNFSGGGVLFPNWSAMESQSVGPVPNIIEMGHQNVAWATGVIENKLNNAAPLALATGIPASIPPAWLGMTYRQIFDMVFAASAIPAIAVPQGVSRERFAMAIAAYERTLVPDQAPIDTNTMTPQELLGFDVFVASGCVRCHSVSGNPIMVNRVAPVIGTLANRWDNSFSDGFPHDIFITNPGRSVGPVKTPTLRNVGLRQRFFHDGLGRIVGGVPQNSIPAIVDFYDIDQDPVNGGPGGPFELRSLGGAPGLTPFERAAVIAFLGNALTDPRVAGALPPFDRPTLYSESVPFGSNLILPATAAAPGWQPLMIADVPPHNPAFAPPWWKIGVGSNGGGAGAPIIPPGSTAMLFMDVATAGPGPFFLPAPVLVHNNAFPGTTNEGFDTSHAPVGLVPGSVMYFQWVVTDFAGWVGYSEVAVLTAF